MKETKVDKLVKELNLSELQEAITRLSSKEDETETENVETKPTETKVEKEEKVSNNATKEEVAELNTKMTMLTKMFEESLKNVPVGVKRKVVTNATGEDETEYSVENVFNNLKNLKRK